MTGIKWRPKYEALQAEHERTVDELNSTKDMLVAARSMVDELQREVGRAKLEGARGLAEFMLADQ